MKDRFGRTIDYLRVSVTDRCNLRCRYCMPVDGVPALAHDDILRFEEIETVVRALAVLGVRRVKLTGGEPLCRRSLPALARLLYAVPGIDEVTLTTNGLLLPEQATALRAAGIVRVNISLDSLQPARYAALTRCGTLAQALAGIDAACAAGMQVKLNMVPIQGENEEEILDFIAFGRARGLVVRFIELMPIGRETALSGLSGAALLETVRAGAPGFSPFPGKLGNGPADCYGWPDGGTFGIISAVHNRFCDTCNRVRLTADGQLRLCLGQPGGLDLKPWLRGGRPDLEHALETAIAHKPSGHCFAERAQAERTMNQIGG